MRSLDIAVVATLLDTARTTRAQSGLRDPVKARDEIRRRAAFYLVCPPPGSVKIVFAPSDSWPTGLSVISTSSLPVIQELLRSIHAKPISHYRFDSQ